VRLFAHVSFIAQSPPSVTPLGDFYGDSSRKFMNFCTGASGGEDAAMGCLEGLKSLPLTDFV